MRLPVLRRPQMSAICSKALPISSSSNIGRSSGVFLAGVGSFIVRNRSGSLSWLCSLSYSKRFHLFPTQPPVVKSTQNFRARVWTAPSDLVAVSNRLVKLKIQTYLVLDGFSKISLCICSNTLLMCWKSGTVSF